MLKEPDLLNLGASVQRADLLERNGILELGIEVTQDAQAQRGGVEWHPSRVLEAFSFV